MDLSMAVKFVLLGVSVGTLGGLFGVGGGVLMVPALVIMIGMAQKSAQGISLIVMVPMALFAFLRYRAMGAITLDWGAIGLLALGAVCGAFLGTGVVGSVSNRPLQTGFGIFMICVGAYMIFRASRGA
jgi:hypothetical protein